MPCNSSHLEPRFKETESRKIATFIAYIHEQTRDKTPDNILAASESVYGNESLLDSMTTELCALCKSIDPSIIYNAHNRTARKLANWWEDHQEVDQIKEREANEQD